MKIWDLLIPPSLTNQYMPSLQKATLIHGILSLPNPPLEDNLDCGFQITLLLHPRTVYPKYFRKNQRNEYLILNSLHNLEFSLPPDQCFSKYKPDNLQQNHLGGLLKGRFVTPLTKLDSDRENLHFNILCSQVGLYVALPDVNCLRARAGSGCLCFLSTFPGIMFIK